jgi:GNAT superfamily N-acetyltransferase
MKPVLVLKELNVMPEKRGAGVGESLFVAVQQLASNKGCDHVSWRVLNTNKRAMRFYGPYGGWPDQKWQLWEWRPN